MNKDNTVMLEVNENQFLQYLSKYDFSNIIVEHKIYNNEKRKIYCLKKETGCDVICFEKICEKIKKYFIKD